MTIEEIRTYYVTARNFVKIGNSANTQIINIRTYQANISNGFDFG